MTMKREQHTNGSKTEVKLWEYFYRVRVPYLQSRTVEDIRTTGVNVTGIPSIDNDIKNQLITSINLNKSNICTWLSIYNNQWA